MNFLYLTHHPPQRVTFRAGNFARIMASRGHKVSVVHISSDSRFRGSCQEQEGIHWIHTPDLLPGKLRSGWDPYDTLWRSIHLKKAWKEADVIHLFETRPVTIFPFLYLQRQFPKATVIDWNDWWGRGGLITELRPLWYQHLFGAFETWFEEHFRNRAHATTLISEGLQPRAIALGAPEASIFKVTGAARTSHFSVIPSETHREQFGLPLQSPILAYAGLDAHLDLPLAVEAFRIARKQRQDLQLLLVGGASISTPEAGIHVLGHLDWERFPEALSCADIFLLPFRDKPANRGRWPNKVMDYLACGRPVLTNPTGEMIPVFADGLAGQLAPESPEDFARAILQLIDQPEKRNRMGRHARHLAESTFNQTTLAEQLQSAYDFAISHCPTFL